MIVVMKVRIEPNDKQRTKMFQGAGVARWAYNWALRQQDENYKNGGKFIQDGDLRKQLTQLKKADEFKWLNECSNNITKQAIKDACDAYKRFFKKKAQFPKFKSKKRSKPAFYQDTHKITFYGGKVRLEKIGWVRLSEKNRIPEGVSYTNPRMIFDGVHWYVSVGVEIEKASSELNEQSIGIDLGLKDLAVCSYENKRYKSINKTSRVKSIEKRLRHLQRQVSNKYELNKKGGSYVKTKNIIKLENQIRKLHRRLDHIRTDYIHKVTSEIAKTKPKRIVMETLNVSGMLKNRHLSKAIAQQKLYFFRTAMKYKAEWQSTEFVEADKWYPSSKTCSICGFVKSKLSLSDRVFECECCGSAMDRDENAAVNLSRYQVS